MALFSTFLLAVIFTTAAVSEQLHPLSNEFIKETNNRQSLWKAERYFSLQEYELFKVLASGFKKSDRPRIYQKIHDENEDVPESFDSRVAWPECADIIGLIRDQSRCGACWAFSAVEVMSDRICILSNATRKLLVSPVEVLTCNDLGSCNGGDPHEAFTFWQDQGLVTGGLYNRTDQGCKSYFLPPCEDHPNQCVNYIPTPACVQVCDDPSLEFESQKTYGKDAVTLSGEKQIQLEILKNGPVSTLMLVNEDFVNYRSGIYKHIQGGLVAPHLIKILGWGVENDVKYWLLANSWNERWGENGFFRVLRGVNEILIETYVNAALPDFSKF